MGSQALTCLLVTTLLLALVVTRWSSTPPPAPAPAVPSAEFLELTKANEELQARLRTLEALQSAGASASVASPSGGLTAELLQLHSHWDWQSIAHDMLQPFSMIDRAMLENGVKECYQNGTMYCARLQVHNNELYLTDYRAVFFDRHYAPARIIPMLHVLRRHKIPNVDLVVAAVDEPRVKTSVNALEWTRLIAKYPSGASLPPPLFSSTVDRMHLDLAWPDFSFYMPRRPHKLRTPPWSKLHAQMLNESASLRWDDKIPLAVHTGNVGSPYRKRLAAQAQAAPAEMLVNELFIGDHGRIKSTCASINKHRVGGYQQHVCYMTFVEQCSYKYLLNSASIGYANKFKYLLLCGSVVIYVRDGMSHKEFYEYGLLPGVHYVSVADATAVPAMVRWLKEHDTYARAVAMAGRARMASLTVEAVADFMGELLAQVRSPAFSRLLLPSPSVSDLPLLL